jgi:bifunctional non-homologous end joining protein LigD
MAIHVEDHPLSYGGFEGTIPAEAVRRRHRDRLGPRHLGAGGDPRQGLKDGKLVFRCTATSSKACGSWCASPRAASGRSLDPVQEARRVRARPRAEYDVVSALPDSVIAKPLRRRSPPSRACARRVRAPGAVKAPLPAKLKPQLATLAAGVRRLRRVDLRDQVRRLPAHGAHRGRQGALITRGGHDWSAKMPRWCVAGGARPRSCWLDGEIVVLGANGTPDFNALQNAFDRHARRIIVFFLFDVPFFEGYDLRKVPLLARRSLLQGLLEEGPAEHCASAPASRPTRPRSWLGAPDEPGRRDRQAQGRALRIAAAARPGSSSSASCARSS